jgi:3-phenylpropionate/cinnamic acid dioxygenase small subunit
MYGPYARVALILAKGGHADGPKRQVMTPFFMLYDRDCRYLGWCKATTIESMEREGLLEKRPEGAMLVLWQHATQDLRRRVERLMYGS